jgi:hypothetical protein
MSDSEPTSEDRQPMVGWLRYHGRPVMLQLKEPYYLVTYGYEPDVTKEGGVKAVPFLRGMLSVEPAGDGGAILMMTVPVPKTNDTLLVAVQPKDVLYCTHINESRIVTG